MEIDDLRAFRPHLDGRDLDRARERFLAAILRSPSLWASAARSKIGRHHFSFSLRPVFDLATGAPEKIRDVVMSGNNVQVRTLLGVPVHLHHGVILSLARQIVESADRSDPADVGRGKDSAGFPQGSDHYASSEKSEQVVDTSVVAPAGPVKHAQKRDAAPQMGGEETGTSKYGNEPTSEVLATCPAPHVSGARVSADNVVAVPATSVGQTSDKPKPVDVPKAAAVAFLRNALAHGPVAARKIETLAVEAGLLAEGKSIGDAKTFRTARASLGVKSYQPRGRKSGGWFWVLPDATGTAVCPFES